MDFEKEIRQLKQNVVLAKAQQAVDEDREAPPETKAKIIVRVMQNGLEATMLLHPTSPNTAPPTKEEIMAELEKHGITQGINMALIDDLCDKPVYYHVFAVARGTPPKTGENGYVKYLVNLTVDRRPVIGEDGIADYKNIDFFRIVNKNQPLCEIVPPQKGVDGVDVHGNVLPGRDGDSAFDPSGKNTDYNAEGTILYSVIDGHASLQYGKINVVEVLTIADSVGNATGNIDFVGDVVIRGDVAPGFSVKSGGSIVIQGSVEGAHLEAGTDISVSTGMLGMNVGEINAGGNIKCKFIQNCTVRAFGHIYADSILFSDVTCGGDLVLGGTKSALIGGRASVGGKLVAKTIGSSQQPLTEIKMCTSSAESDEIITMLREAVKAANADIQNYIQVLARCEDKRARTGLDREQTREVIRTTELYREAVKTREAAETKLQDLQRRQVEDGMEVSYIECAGNVHANTKITFGRETLSIDEPVPSCRVHVSVDGVAVDYL